MALTAEELKQIIEGVSANVIAAQPAAPAPATDSAPAPASIDPNAPFNPAAFMQQIETMVGTVMDNKLKPIAESAQASTSATTQIWSDQIKQLETSNPTMHAYLQGNDEWGTPRIQTLEKEEDYAKRMQSFRSLMTQVQQAQAAGAHTAAPPVIPQKVQDAADKHNKAVADLDNELEKGEMDMNDYARQSFDLMEAEGLFGTPQ